MPVFRPMVTAVVRKPRVGCGTSGWASRRAGSPVPRKLDCFRGCPEARGAALLRLEAASERHWASAARVSRRPALAPVRHAICCIVKLWHPGGQSLAGRGSALGL